MTVHEAASLIRAVRRPRSNIERDLAISRLVIALAREMATEDERPLLLAREIMRLATAEVA